MVEIGAVTEMFRFLEIWVLRSADMTSSRVRALNFFGIPQWRFTRDAPGGIEGTFGSFLRQL